MSKNIIIQEGGVNKTLNAIKKIQTTKSGNGEVLWVPEEEVKLTTKNIKKDGTYIAKDDGAYGYSKVTVKGIGKATGKDKSNPDDKNEYDFQEDGNGGVEKKLIPSSIKITTNPSRVVYTDGQDIDIAGIVVKLYLGDGNLFTDNEYPQGVVSISELTFTPTKAQGGGGDPTPGGGERDDGVYYVASGGQDPVCTQSDGTGGLVVAPTGAKYCGIMSGNTLYVCYIFTKPFEIYSYKYDGEKEDTNESSQIEYNGQAYYYAVDNWGHPTPSPTINYTILPSAPGVTVKTTAMSIILGSEGHESDGSGKGTVTVHWESPYNGKDMMDKYEITIN